MLGLAQGYVDAGSATGNGGACRAFQGNFVAANGFDRVLIDGLGWARKEGSPTARGGPFENARRACRFAHRGRPDFLQRGRRQDDAHRSDRRTAC